MDSFGGHLSAYHNQDPTFQRWEPHSVPTGMDFPEEAQTEEECPVRRPQEAPQHPGKLPNVTQRDLS